uniref:Ovule protein n=1 Tax=Mesocestoides corti TaxID=53468 RepID=A0A5K3FHH8_MESCO
PKQVNSKNHLETRETKHRHSRCSVVWCGVGLGPRHVGPPGLSQSRVSLRSNGMRERKAANQRRTRVRCSI